MAGKVYTEARHGEEPDEIDPIGCPPYTSPCQNAVAGHLNYLTGHLDAGGNLKRNTKPGNSVRLEHAFPISPLKWEGVALQFYSGRGRMIGDDLIWIS